MVGNSDPLVMVTVMVTLQGSTNSLKIQPSSKKLVSWYPEGVEF